MRKLSDLPSSQTHTALEHLRHWGIRGPLPQQRDAKEKTVWVSERENHGGKVHAARPRGKGTGVVARGRTSGVIGSRNEPVEIMSLKKQMIGSRAVPKRTPDRYLRLKNWIRKRPIDKTDESGIERVERVGREKTVGYLPRRKIPGGSKKATEGEGSGRME